MPPAAISPAILVIAAVTLLLLKAGPSRWWRFSGTICLLAFAVAGFGLSTASHHLPETTSSTIATQGQAAINTPELEFDSLALTFSWAVLGLGILLTLPSQRLQARSSWAPECYAGLLFSIAGCMLLCMARDLIVLALSLELVTLPILLIRVTRQLTRSTLQATAQSLMMSLLSIALLWFGIAILYGLSGTTRMPECIQIIAAGRVAVEPATLVGNKIQLGVPAAVLILAGLGTKVGSVLSQLGKTDVSDSMPAWQAALPVTVVTASCTLAAWRLFGQSWGGELDQAIVLILLLVAASTMLAGAFMAGSEIRIPRLLIWCAVAHAGNALMGVTIGAAAGFFYLGSYTFAIAGIYALLNYLSTGDREIEYVDDLAGLLRTQPLAALSATILFLALAGLPPLPLFWGNLTLLLTAFAAAAGSDNIAFAQSNLQFAAMAAATAFSSLLLAAVYFRLIAAMLLKIQVGRQRPTGGHLALAAAIVVAMLTLGLGLWPAPVLEHLNQIVPASNR